LNDTFAGMFEILYKISLLNKSVKNNFKNLRIIKKTYINVPFVKIAGTKYLLKFK
jgi:hypothetical protein